MIRQWQLFERCLADSLGRAAWLGLFVAPSHILAVAVNWREP
jgi:hypothetical protein